MKITYAILGVTAGAALVSSQWLRQTGAAFRRDAQARIQRRATRKRWPAEAAPAAQCSLPLPPLWTKPAEEVASQADD